MSKKQKRKDIHPDIKVRLIYNGQIVEDPSTLTVHNKTVDRIINATVERKLAALNLKETD